MFAPCLLFFFVIQLNYLTSLLAPESAGSGGKQSAASPEANIDLRKGGKVPIPALSDKEEYESFLNSHDLDQEVEMDDNDGKCSETSMEEKENETLPRAKNGEQMDINVELKRRDNAMRSLSKEERSLTTTKSNVDSRSRENSVSSSTTTPVRKMTGSDTDTMANACPRRPHRSETETLIEWSHLERMRPTEYIQMLLEEGFEEEEEDDDMMGRGRRRGRGGERRNGEEEESAMEYGGGMSGRGRGEQRWECSIDLQANPYRR